ncbi:MAG: undecaprenyl/decaprenyl-phosphate alpha-N-acetylglucosaminyl 1-phosphate transferase [Flavobacteriaceae bacterium]|nr:undecaprenyl/decaprenyl-phosphate alpha-N-acetylglucosaminyl 1-phosphate transferase [Flavobacteriaceae bacterium]
MIKTLLENFDVSAYLIPWLLLAFLFSFFISLRSYPPLLYIAKEKHLFDEPDSRSIHSTKVPTLGGVGVYLSLILILSLAGAVLNSRILIITSGAITLLFFLGLKDDLLVLSPKKKFLGQIIASALLVTATDIRIIGFSNIFSVEFLPYWASILFTVFVFILVINAYNLIDGIDGLAGSIAVFSSCIFGVLFYQTNNVNASTIAFTLVGALLPFLWYNFSKNKKIFMGDTGSMIIGFLLAFFVVSFLSDTHYNHLSFYKNSGPVIGLAILFFPLMDTFRIFVIRIFVYKKSPFIADKNHVHHRFLALGYTHKQSTALIVVINSIIVSIAFNLTHLEIHLQLFIMVFIGLILFTIPFFLKTKVNFKKDKLQKKNSKHI